MKKVYIFPNDNKLINYTFLILLTAKRKRTHRTELHLSLRLSIITTKPKSASCNLKPKNKTYKYL